MKIAACLAVKDEIELIGHAIDHLQGLGVDHIIASDAGSTDGTEAVLARRARGADFDLLPYDDTIAGPEHEAAANADIIARARAVGADWLLFVDADEFPLIRSGRLRDVAALRHADALSINRFNVPLLASGLAMQLPSKALADVLLYAPDEGRAASQARVRQDDDAPWIGVIPGPKMMIRLDRVTALAEGHHGAGPAEAGATVTAVPQDLLIAHVPFLNAARFGRKLANIRQGFAKTGHAWGPDSAWHWRRWLDTIDRIGGIEGEVARNTVTPDELAALQDLGVVKSAAALLA